jgi:hypothetical protein
LHKDSNNLLHIVGAGAKHMRQMQMMKKDDSVEDFIFVILKNVTIPQFDFLCE